MCHCTPRMVAAPGALIAWRGLWSEARVHESKHSSQWVNIFALKDFLQHSERRVFPRRFLPPVAGHPGLHHPAQLYFFIVWYTRIHLNPLSCRQTGDPGRISIRLVFGSDLGGKLRLDFGPIWWGCTNVYGWSRARIARATWSAGHAATTYWKDYYDWCQLGSIAAGTANGDSGLDAYGNHHWV